MLTWVIIFLVISLVAGLLGFTGVSEAAGGIAQIIFFVFMVMFLMAFVLLAGGMFARP